VIGRLVALQAQEPNWPYAGLWSRIHGFTQSGLTTLLEDRKVVRTGLDAASLVAEGLGLLAGGTLTRRELARLLAERHPGRDGRILAGEVELRTPLVHDPATGAWASWGNRSKVSVTSAEAWPGRPMETAVTTATAKGLIRRYLAGFGPAGVKDVQAWCGLTRLNDVVAQMRTELRRYSGPDGGELIDLADADLPDPDTPAPVRLLPAFDNVLLGHADRTRILGDQDRRHVMPGQARVRPAFLVDGRVHGTWSLDAGTLRLTPFRTADEVALEHEAGRLLPFVGGRKVSYDPTP
jgi:hypothetical protein